MTASEELLRAGLKELATVPGPPDLADQALARATRMRRRRVVLTGAGAVVLAGVVAVPVTASNLGSTPAGSGGTSGGGSGSCRTVTDESKEQNGVPREQWPEFVAAAVARMPARDDYILQSGYGVCPGSGEEQAYAVINLGWNRHYGHVTVTLTHRDPPASCAALPISGEPLFCDEATATTPLVFGISPADDSVVVTAIYPDRRVVSMESNGSPFGREELTAVVTDRALADLLS